ncbi:MAG: transposase [Flavobacteriales bacterium]|nr:transposase [Flavobacteriales bacterium]
MSEFLKANEEGACYFVTLTTVGWVDVFTRREYVDIIFDNLEFCRRNKGLEVFHYVLMPSHLHMIARRERGLLSEVLRDFKSYTAKLLLKAIEEHPQESRREWMMRIFREHGQASAQNSVFMFWQKTSHPELLYSPAFFEQKAEYIRNNPVVMGLVTEPEHYALSSAHEQPIMKVDEE